MRTLLRVCVGIGMVAVVVSVHLWRELRVERQRTADLQAQLDDAKIAVRVSTAAAQHANAPVPTTETAGKVDAAPVAGPAPASTSASAQRAMNLEQDLMKDPEYRKLRLAQLRTSIERNNPGLAEELGLSEQEAGRLYDLLAENQLAMNFDSSIPGESAIRGLLGEGKYAQWQEYQQARPARQRVMSMNTQLTQAGMPLSDSQSRALTTAMLAEQQRQRQDQQARVRTAASGNQNDPDFRAQAQEEALKRNEENSRRMLDAAAPSLTAKQLAALREQMEQQAAMTRIVSRMQMERDREQQQAQGVR